MLRFLPRKLRVVISMSLLCGNTALHCLPIFCLALAKLVVPLPAWRGLCTRLLNVMTSSWITVNGFWIGMVRKNPWDVDIRSELSPDNWYLVTCNHQSWADIFISQQLLNRRVPQMKFFLKQELIWVPVIGLVWWALDFPFMKRYSKQYLKKHPEKRGKDFETTRRACAKFRHLPAAIFNFMEGTRFTPDKHQRQSSPYRHLLKPRPGGTGYVLGAMGEQLQALIDITIYYPEGVPGFRDFLSGDKSSVKVVIDSRPLPQHLRSGDYGSDPVFRAAVQKWVNEIWQEKDELLESLAAES